MATHLLGFFSGFPNKKFPYEIAKRLREELQKRDNFVCVSAWPSDYDRNDIDLVNMHGLFADYDMPFMRQYVIDNRTEPSRAQKLIDRPDSLGQQGQDFTSYTG